MKLGPFKSRQPMANNHSNAEQKALPLGQLHVPLGVVRPCAVISVQPFSDADIEEEEVVINEEEHVRPSLEETIEMGGRDEREPSECRGNHRDLLEHIGFAARMPGEAVKPVNGESDGENPWPEKPSPAKVHPEEGVEEPVDRPLCGGDCDG